MKEFIFHKICVLNDWTYCLQNDKGEENVTKKLQIQQEKKTNKEQTSKEKILLAIIYFQNSTGICNKENIKDMSGLNNDEIDNILNILLKDCTIFIENGSYVVI